MRAKSHLIPIEQRDFSLRPLEKFQLFSMTPIFGVPFRDDGFRRFLRPAPTSVLLAQRIQLFDCEFEWRVVLF